jgi:hypothetical protein
LRMTPLCINNGRAGDDVHGTPRSRHMKHSHKM